MSDAPGLSSSLDKRPIIVAIAGSNGAGKTTFYESHLSVSGLRFVNTDVIARELGVEAYDAAHLSSRLRVELVAQRESFIFETVFSDPVGDKLAFLKGAARSGYMVVLCFIGIPGTGVSEERVAMRVTQGGYDVPSEKLRTRFPRTLDNLRSGIRELPMVHVYDNGDLRVPFREVAVFEGGNPMTVVKPLPAWFRSIAGA